MKKNGLKNIFRFGSGITSGSRFDEKESISADISVDTNSVPEEKSVEEQQRDCQESNSKRQHETEYHRRMMADPFHIQELEDADKSFHRDDYDEAIVLYLSAIPLAQDRLPPYDSTVGDINVKISIILQGRGELSSAIEHLIKAKDVYHKLYIRKEEESTVKKEILGHKLVEVSTGIANLYVDTGEMEKASACYEDVIVACTEHSRDDSIQLSVALNTYANFLSMCLNRHEEALEKLKKALKISIKARDEKMTVDCAPTLNNMGRVYMRRANPSNYAEAQEDAKQAEVCFNRALQLYRMSLVKNTSERVTDTIYYMNQARERQSGKRGILRNVRFDSQPIQRQYTAKSFGSYGSDDESSVTSSSMASSSVFTTATDATDGAFGLMALFQCGENTTVSAEFGSDEASINSQERERAKANLDPNDSFDLKKRT